MRRYIYLLLIFSMLVAACASTGDDPTTFVASENLDEMVIPAIDVADGDLPEPLNGKLNIYGDTPIFEEGLDEAWDRSLVLPGAVIYHGGLFHLFYNGLIFNRGLEGGGIGYAISADGVEWYRMADAPLFNWDDTIGEDYWLQASSALIEDDGTWVIYMSSASRGITEDLPAIYRANAPAPNGPWTFDDVPMLEPGETGEWDYYGVEDPSVVKTDDGYLMYYLNARFDNRRGISGIGLATSIDGINWVKYNDPTTEERFATSDPIFSYEGDMAGYESIQSYVVWQDAEGFSMLYGAGRNATNEMFYLTSAEGVTWSAHFDDPVFTTEDVDFIGNVRYPKILSVNGKYLVYFYGNAAQSAGDIYLATVAE